MKKIPMKAARAPDPIENIQWRSAEELIANSYNPNVVMNQELKLLERSLLRTGWVQPILISRDNIIIDGFHRTMLSRTSDKVKARWGGKVPCAVLDIDRGQAMVMTIRMNRAKGTHVAVRMSLIVRELIDIHHYDPQEVAIEIGATGDEVELLRQDGVFKMKNIEDYAYSRAWYPKETNGPAGKES